MLSWDDEPTIRHSIQKRLGSEPGVAIAEIRIKPHQDETPPFLAVGVLTLLDDTLILRSMFHLPEQFELRHVHNEIDEIAEGCKSARNDYVVNGIKPRAQKRLLGNGLRGQWGRYG